MAPYASSLNEALTGVDRVLYRRPFKNPSGKAQKKFEADAYLTIREDLDFLQQRSHA
jgi:hypothetical protein